MKKLDKIIIVDVESTCWEGNPPPNQVSEIIEIGVCMLDIHTHEVSDLASFFTKPISSYISYFCTNLTTITAEMIEAKGIDFVEACQILKKEYDSKNRIWGSWGDYDRNQFERNCKHRNIAYPFGQTHLNIKALFALKHQLKHEVGMDKALEILGLPLKGTHHRGIDDAENIASILKTLI